MKRIINNVLLAAVFIACLVWLIQNPEPARATRIRTYNSTDYCLTLIVPLGVHRITGYDTCITCCGKTDGITASGTQATPGRTIAMKGIEFGTEVFIAGLGSFTVEDRGVGVGVVDVCCATHEECYALTGDRHVYIIN